jgi:hypothetical protein
MHPSLQIQPFRLSLTLSLHNTFPRAPEVRHLNSHPPLSQRHQPSLATNGLNIRAGKIIFLVDEFIQVHVVGE